MANQSRHDWTEEDAYWREHYKSRPYASNENDYAYYQPGYRYGYESASKYSDRSWDEMEASLSSRWDTYEHRGQSTWEQMKDAVRDAWHRVTGKQHAGAHH